jgi:hypothetical protein
LRGAVEEYGRNENRRWSCALQWVGAEFWYFLRGRHDWPNSSNETINASESGSNNVGLAGTVFIWIFVFLVLRFARDENPPFAAAFENAFIGDNRDAALIYAYTGEQEVSPVPLLFAIRVVNRQSVPATISKFTIEIEKKKGFWIFPSQWLKTVSVPDRMPLVIVNSRAEVSSVTLANSRLEPTFRARPLRPHETVRGLVLLDVKEEFNSIPRPLIFRISLRDTAGNSFTVIGPANPDDNMAPSTGFRVDDRLNIGEPQLRHIADWPN